MKIIIALPVYNEELVLESNAIQVLDFCRRNFSQDEFKIVIADNNSSDQTGVIGQRLANGNEELEYLFVAQKGKGGAWKQTFMNSDADVYIFMDIDLAVDLEALVPMMQSVEDGCDLVIGSRHLKESKVERSWRRTLISKSYVWLASRLLGTKISDLQCGFKAINNRVKDILATTEDNGFFLDTELLVMAERLGYSIKEIPVNWSEFRNNKRKSTLNIWRTGWDYIKKCLILNKKLSNKS